MKAETPRVTVAFFALCVEAYHIRRGTMIHENALAKLTATSIAYWVQLREAGNGPKHCEDYGLIWYRLADVQDWLEENIFNDLGGRYV